MKISQLASKRNLELAWRRITTGGNFQYKRLYRLCLLFIHPCAPNLINLRSASIMPTWPT